MRHGLQGYAGQGPTGPSDRRPGRPVVAVVGAGAAGTLTAIHLVDQAARERRALDIVLLDPRPDIARGVAYSTTDQRHLLNVPAGGMSALPAEPGHLVDWLRAHGRPDAGPADFVPRADYGRYLDETLAAMVDATPDVACEHRCQRVTHARPVPGGVHLVLAGGSLLAADAVVLAPGIFAPGTAWAPDELRASDRFVADPWAPGALDALDQTDGDVLLVGTGLTMVDLALTLARPGRTLRAVSRRGRVPAAHTTRPKPPTPAPSPELADQAAGLAPTDLPTMRRLVRDCVTAAVRETGDWRPAFDTLRAADGGPLVPARCRRARRLRHQRRRLVGPAPPPDGPDLGDGDRAAARVRWLAGQLRRDPRRRRDGRRPHRVARVRPPGRRRGGRQLHRPAG